MSKSETVDLVVNHELRGVTPEMLDWWWDHIDTTERYNLWHPEDHKSFKWEVSPKKGHVGAIHFVLEDIGGIPTTLRIRWENPSSVPISTTYSHVVASSVLDQDGKPSVGSYMNMRKCRTERECAQHFDYPQGFLNGFSKACASIVKRRWRIYLNFFQNCTRKRTNN